MGNQMNEYEVRDEFERKSQVSVFVLIRKLMAMFRELPVFSSVVLLVFLLIGLFGNMIAPYDPTMADFEYTLAPPFWQEGGTIKHPLGTDQFGRDILSRMICGTRISLEVGIITVALGGLIGTLVAILAGYLGGWVDIILMRLTDTMLSLPYLMIAITFAAILGPSKNNIIIVLAVVGWARYARVLRGEVLSLRESNFVSLAIISGVSKAKIMLVHIFPNIINTLIILATLQLGMVIIAEAALSFLGVGVPPPNPAWGLMIAEGRDYIASAWWLCAWPGLAIMLVVLSFNLFGDWLRVRLDPKFRQL